MCKVHGDDGVQWKRKIPGPWEVSMFMNQRVRGRPAWLSSSERYDIVKLIKKPDDLCIIQYELEDGGGSDRGMSFHCSGGVLPGFIEKVIHWLASGSDGTGIVTTSHHPW
jgi:hypothetical protein